MRYRVESLVDDPEKMMQFKQMPQQQQNKKWQLIARQTIIRHEADPDQIIEDVFQKVSSDMCRNTAEETLNDGGTR